MSFKGREKDYRGRIQREEKNVLRKKTFHLAPALKRSRIKRKLVNLVSYRANDAAGGFYSS